MAHLRTTCLLLLCLNSLTDANSTYLPRMIFTDKGNTFIRKPLPAHPAPVRILLTDQQDAVAVVGPRHLKTFDFQNSETTPAERTVVWKDCSSTDCNYNITVVQQREIGNSLFACGTNGREALCCNMDILEPSPTCVTSSKVEKITESIGGFVEKESKHSILVESEHSADLYMTYSGSQGSVGLYKFGSKRVMPAGHNKEQHYAGLVLSRRQDDPSQDRVYSLYRQKNRDSGLDGGMWTSYVSQVCMADVGGPKNQLQFQWTSQMNARLYCGDPESKQHFSELVDTATVHAESWRDTKIYALFRNEWGMSAVCVYTVGDIDDVFAHSSFKGSSPEMKLDRPRKCVEDSTKISPDTLRIVDKTSEMEGWVRPAGQSHPLLFTHHNYTQVYVDSSEQSRKESNNTVILLTLNNGRIHKVLEGDNQAFVIAEYRPFNHTAHILSILLQPSSKKLFVNTRHEVVQLDVADCSQYGSTCEDCVLSRDPYCSWEENLCSQQTHSSSQQDVTGDLGVCQLSTSKLHRPGKAFPIKDRLAAPKEITLASGSRFFLSCPVSSRHAQYRWLGPRGTTSCSSKEDQCLLLINSMSPQDEGDYQCVSEERNHKKVLARYHLESSAAHNGPGPLLWVCLMIAAIRGLIC